MLYLIVTNKGTLIISPHVQLLNKLGEMLGVELGPMKVEPVTSPMGLTYFRKVA